jgi:hypothetical protein
MEEFINRWHRGWLVPAESEGATAKTIPVYWQWAAKYDGDAELSFVFPTTVP